MESRDTNTYCLIDRLSLCYRVSYLTIHTRLCQICRRAVKSLLEAEFVTLRGHYVESFPKPWVSSKVSINFQIDWGPVFPGPQTARLWSD